MRLVPPLCLSLLLLSGFGCAYRLGPTNGARAGARSVQVLPFENLTMEPRLVEAIGIALRQELQQDGTYQLNTSNEGDIILSGSVIKYQRHSLAFRTKDVLTPSEYRLTITAQITAKERSSGKVLLSRKISGSSEVRVESDLASAERQALPLVATDLARSVTAYLVDGSW